MSARIAIDDGQQRLTADALATRAAQVAATLHDASPRIGVMALMADNGPDWIVIDRAAAAARVPLVPLPPFFTPAQIAAALAASGADALVASDARVCHSQRLERHGWFLWPVADRVVEPAYARGVLRDP